MKMKNNNYCDLELRLRPSFHDSDVLVSSADDGYSVHQHPVTEDFSSKRPEQQQIAIVYDGKVAVSEVTELQAKAIIMLARGDVDPQRTRTSSLESSKLVCNNNNNNNKLSPTGLCMKRSLQRFFQKRHQRIQNSSPYSHHKPCVFSNLL